MDYYDATKIILDVRKDSEQAMYKNWYTSILNTTRDDFNPNITKVEDFAFMQNAFELV